MFDAVGGWTGNPVPWPVTIEGLTLEVRPTSSGGLGIYPEHAANLAWLARQIQARPGQPGGERPSVLNLFGHTGLVTLAAARAGAAVTHVDAARSAVAWARRNAALSGLADRPTRWLVDDARTFVAREARRGRRYAGIVLYPPSFGRAGRRRWRLEEELPALLEACRAVAAEDAFVLLTAHTTGFAGEALAGTVAAAFPTRRSRTAVEPLALDATSGARLDLGWSVRLAG